MADRAFVLGRLQRELRAAEDVHEAGYAAQIRAEIARLSAGTPEHPARETLAPRRPAVKAGQEEVGSGAVRPRRRRSPG